MRNETILYYVWEETITGCKRIVKTHFWRKIEPLSFVAEEDGLSVVTVMIPEISKGWKKEKLLELMQAWMRKTPEYAGADEIVVHPGLQSFLRQCDDFSRADGFSQADGFWPEHRFRREDNFPSVFWDLVDECFKGEFVTKKRTIESVVLLMGSYFFPEEQIERFSEMLQPHFARVNNLAIIYEDTEEDAGQGMNADVGSKTRQEEAIDDFMEMLYYEYGLVGRVCRGGNYKEMDYGVRSGMRQAFYLDYGYSGKLPYSMMRAGGIYIDVLSSEEKEQRIRKKCSEISYYSPRKYLDTMVKSGYDKLVNQA